MVIIPSTPSLAAWSSRTKARVTERLSAASPGLTVSWYSGRTPAQARSMRISLKPGTSLSPSSRHRLTSQGSMAKWSGSGTLTSVVPITETVWAGTRISPSAGMRQRLITVWTMRWFIASMVPLPAMILSSMPAVAAIMPAQAPAALTTRSAGNRNLLPACQVLADGANHPWRARPRQAAAARLCGTSESAHLPRRADSTLRCAPRNESAEPSGT